MDLHDYHAPACTPASQMDVLEFEALESAGRAAAAPRVDLQKVADAAAAYVEIGAARANAALGRMLGADRRVGTDHIRIMLGLMTSASGKSGMSWMTYEELAEYAMVCKKTVRNRCCELERWGYIARTDPRKANGRGLRRLDTAMRPAGAMSWLDLDRITRSLSAIVEHREAVLTAEIARRRGVAEPQLSRVAGHPISESDVPMYGTTAGMIVPTGTIDLVYSISSPTGPRVSTGQREARALTSAVNKFDREVHKTSEWNQIAIDAGIPADRVSDQIDAMANYAAAKGQRFVDWTARWRAWCRQYRPELDLVPARQPLVRSLDDQVQHYIGATEKGNAIVRQYGRERAEGMVRAVLETSSGGGTHD